MLKSSTSTTIKSHELPVKLSVAHNDPLSQKPEAWIRILDDVLQKSSGEKHAPLNSNERATTKNDSSSRLPEKQTIRTKQFPQELPQLTTYQFRLSDTPKHAKEKEIPTSQKITKNSNTDHDVALNVRSSSGDIKYYVSKLINTSGAKNIFGKILADLTASGKLKDVSESHAGLGVTAFFSRMSTSLGERHTQLTRFVSKLQNMGQKVDMKKVLASISSPDIKGHGTSGYTKNQLENRISERNLSEIRSKLKLEETPLSGADFLAKAPQASLAPPLLKTSAQVTKLLSGVLSLEKTADMKKAVSSLTSSVTTDLSKSISVNNQNSIRENTVTIMMTDKAFPFLSVTIQKNAARTVLRMRVAQSSADSLDELKRTMSEELTKALGKPIDLEMEC